MAGSTFRICKVCDNRRRVPKGDRRCPGCGTSRFSWYFKVNVAPQGAPRQDVKRGGFDSQGEAAEAMRKLLEDVGAGGPIDTSKLTVGEFLDQWLQSRKLTVSESHWADQRGLIDRHIRARIGHVPLTQLTALHLNGMYADVRDNGRRRGEGPLSLKTVRDLHTIMNKALRDARRWRFVRENVAVDADPPSATAVLNARKGAISTWGPSEIATFREHLADTGEPWVFTAWVLAGWTGMRRGEVLGLRWRDIDFERGRVAVRQVIVIVGGTSKIKPIPKTAGSYRSIDVPEQVLAALRRHRLAQNEVRLAVGPDWQDHGLVFARPTRTTKEGHPPGTWFHPDTFTTKVRQAIEASGVPKIRPLQDLRHSHATLLIAAGEPVKVVQERLGHHSAAFTQDTYQHVLPGMQRKAADTFDRLVSLSGDEDAAGAAVDPS